MNRKKELLNLIGDNKALIPMVDEMVYLEEQLEIFRALPKIKLHPSDPAAVYERSQDSSEGNGNGCRR